MNDLEALERVVGRVQEGRELPRTLTMMVAGEGHRASNLSGEFTLLDEEGHSVEVRVSEATKIGPPVTRSGRWADVMNDPLAADERLAAHAPGDHVEVELSGVVLAPGDEVIVEGSAEYSRENAGYRDDGERVLSRVRAERIAVGEDDVRWLAELEAASDAKARERAEWEEEYQRKQIAEARARDRGRERPITGGVTLAILASVAWSVGVGLLWRSGLPQEPVGRYAALSLIPIGVLLAGLSMFVCIRRRMYIRMLVATLTTEVGLPWELSAGPGAYTFALVLQAMCVSAIVATTQSVIGSVTAALHVAIPVLIVTAQALWLATRFREGVGLLNGFGATARGSGDDWASREGKVEVGELTRSSVYTLATSGSHVGGGIQAGIVDWSGELSGGTGVLSVRIGERLVDVIVDGHARWGTTRRFAEMRSRTKAVLTETIKPGDDVLVLGRVTADEMRAGGPESLILFASHRGSARAAVRRAVWKHRLAMAAHPFLMATAIGFAIFTAWVSGGS